MKLVIIDDNNEIVNEFDPYHSLRKDRRSVRIIVDRMKLNKLAKEKFANIHGHYSRTELYELTRTFSYEDTDWYDYNFKRPPSRADWFSTFDACFDKYYDGKAKHYVYILP